MKKQLFILICLYIFSGGFSGSVFAAGEAMFGQQAEQAGKYREALTHYVEALKSTPLNQQLREKIISLAQQIKPAPAIPEDAERHMLRGEAAVEVASDKTGFEKAEREFNAATLIAPWLAAGYFNLSVVQEKSGNFAEAIRSAKLYLLAAPDAIDAPDMRRRIIKLEYKLEQARPKVELDAGTLSGDWKAKILMSDNGMQPTFSPSNWPDGFGGDAFVTLSGDKIDIRVKSSAGEERFTGTIHGTSIEGRFGYQGSCAKEYYSRNFKGEISLDGKMILLVVRGAWGKKWAAGDMVCYEIPEAFTHSKLLIKP